MGEFGESVRQQAAETLRRVFCQEGTPGVDPVLELMGVLLEDGPEGKAPAGESLISTAEWMSWNLLILDREEDVSRSITEILEREEMEFPEEPAKLRQWAANLVLMTLGELTME